MGRETQGVSEDLFGSALQDRLKKQAPLAARMRPETLDEVVGQEKLIAPGKPLRSLIEADRLSSVILWGPPGTGKTTLAMLIARATSKEFVTMSAVTAGVKDVREATAKARQRLAEHGQGTILFLDEVHRFNKAQQDALLPSVEEGLLTLIGATTENPYFEVNAPLLSRSTLFRLEPLPSDAVREPLDRALAAEAATADEAPLNLAQAGVPRAAAPKSNRAAMGLWRAQADVRERPSGAVPAHLRDAHYRSAKKLGHGVGYEYPHDDPRGWVPQDYRPPEVADAAYYEPSDHGFEAEIAERTRRRGT